MWGFVWKFQDFREIGWLTFFVSFVFFVTGSVCKFGHVTFFVRNLACFNNMLIDLDGRYFYGLIGEFNILWFYFFVFYSFYFVCVFCLNMDKEKIWKEGFLKRVWRNRWMKFCYWVDIHMGYDFRMWFYVRAMVWFWILKFWIYWVF